MMAKLIFLLFAIVLAIAGASAATISTSTSTSTKTTTTSSKSTSTSTSSSTKTSSTSTSSSTKSTSSSTKSTSSTSPTATASCAYWLDSLPRKGVAAFNSNSSYAVYRNVKDYGAKGDGLTDDTAAIQLAISSGRPASTITSTNYTAVVYFPPGIYLISNTITHNYYTQIIGNPNCMPTLLASASFLAQTMIEGYVYGYYPYPSTGVFYRQIRNIFFDMTLVPASVGVFGVHWPTAQATSLQNLVFNMSQASGTAHRGVVMEDGSGGFMNDLVFYGGNIGMDIGNQQFTMRNLTFSNSITAIRMGFDWGWMFKGLTITNCTTGVDMSSGGDGNVLVSSVIIIDSSFTKTAVAVLTAHDATSQPAAAGALILENIALNKTPIAIQGPQGTVLTGTTTTTTISGWAAGHAYTPSGPQNSSKSITANPRPASLTVGNAFYQRSKPQYEKVAITGFVTARSQGATGNGVTDDTAALQKALSAAATNSQILFIDAGTYKISKTLIIPPGSKLVGEGYSVIMAAGPFFNFIKDPRPVLQVGIAGQTGQVEMSDLIVSTQGGTAGAILIQWNLASPANAPSGLWDVHTRIGGFVGSSQQAHACPKLPVNLNCKAAFMSMHITPSGSGLYMENNWFWTADHDIDNNDYSANQISVFTGRGLLVESTVGNIWLYGTAIEHHSLYQYQFYKTQNIFMGQIQTETPYWQPAPNASIPFTANASYHDPVYPETSFVADGVSIPNADAWGLRVVNSTGILVYGAGLYSFFNNYTQGCVGFSDHATCQSRIFDVESSTVYLYDLHTVATNEMITLDGKDVAKWSDNFGGGSGFVQEIAVFRTG